MSRFLVIISILYTLSLSLSFRHFYNVRVSQMQRFTQTNPEIEDMMKMIVTAIEEGREEDLIKAGLRITKKPELDSLDEKIQDPEISAKILGAMTDDDEIEVTTLLSKIIDETTQDTEIFQNTNDAFLNLRDELRDDALSSLQELRQRGNTVVSLLDGLATAEDVGFDSLGMIGGESRLIPIVGSTSLLSPIHSTLDNESLSVAPPATRDIEEYDDSDEKKKSKKQGGASSELPISTVYQYFDEKGTTNDQSTEAKSEFNIISPITLDMDKSEFKQIEQEVQLSVEAQSLAQATFTELLKATMADAEYSTKSTDDLMKETLEAASTGNVAQLDINSILGDTMTMLTEQLGIDMKSELASSETKGAMQVLVAQSMAELMSSMEQLDDESQKLQDKLMNLESQLRQESEIFDEMKQVELDELLKVQGSFKNDLKLSGQNLQESTEKLEKLMWDLENNADVLTALALFPVKPVSKKVAFVFGLALVFKVPFDISQLIAIRTVDPSDWLSILVQSLLCLAFMHHYGLVQALFKKN